LTVRRSTVRVWTAFWVCSLLGVCLGASTAAVAAGGANKHTATSTSATSPTPTATAATSASPTPSPAGGGSLGGGLTAPGAIPTTTGAAPTVISTATASTSGAGGLSGGSAIAIAVGAFVVLGGISYFIWRDARRRAPVAARAGPDGDRQNRPGSKAPPKARKLSSAERKRRKRGRAKR
jgi:hypothetical protein